MHRITSVLHFKSIKADALTPMHVIHFLCQFYVVSIFKISLAQNSWVTIQAKNKSDKWLKVLLLIHGIFAVCCVLLLMLGIFKADMAGGDIIGVIVLEFWCAYFCPVCLLAFKYFKNTNE